MSAQLSEMLPYILLGAGVVLVILWAVLGRSSAEKAEVASSSNAADTVAPVAKAASKPKAVAKPKAKAPAKKKAAAKAKAAAAPKSVTKVVKSSKAAAAPKAASAAKAKAKAPAKAAAKAPAKAATKAPAKAAAKAPAKAAAKVAVKTAAKAPAKVATKAKAPAKAKVASAAKAAKPAKGPDNLLLIKGLGPKLNTMLKDQGVTKYSQIAGWSAADIAAIDSKLGAFAGRITRDKFVDQAKLLAKGDIAGFEATYGKLDAGAR